MKNHRFKRILSLILVAALLAGFYVPGAQAASAGLSWKETDQALRLDLSHREVEKNDEPIYQPGDVVRVSIVLEDLPTIQAGYGTRDIARNAAALAYGRSLKAKQDDLAAAISSQVLGGRKLDVVWNLTLAANLISARIPYGHMEAISKMDGVKTVVLENRYEPCVVEREEVAQPQMYASLGMTGSSLTWGAGYTGAGSRVAVVDTGTDTAHQSMDSGAYLYALEQNAKAAGLSYEEYVADLDLLDAQEIASVIHLLKISELIPGVTASQLYLNEKLPFAANYVDGNLTVDHKSDYQGEHGSHVAGIAAANRYIPSGSGYADALSTVYMAGVAPDAQLLTMKVFGGSSPYDSDYMAAIEDAIYLNCDSVNLSLGTSTAGMSHNPYFEALLEYMTQTDTVVVASAGNASNWAAASIFGYLYNDDVNLDTVGAPGSHTNFFTVASVENDGGVGTAFQVADRNMFYGEVTGYGNTALANLDVSASGTGTDYNYVFIDGLGYTEDYAGMDLSGKIVFCSRGTLNFADKANYAMALGASAVIVYNNTAEGVFGMNLTGISYARPCVSISQQDADFIRSASAKQTSGSGITYYTGKITILGSEVGFQANSQYYTMSDFSSWGVPGSLELKPEITAPGGNIYSLWGTNRVTGGGTDMYEVMSGTSMAAPAITGMVALVAQYLRETGLAEQEGMSARQLAQSLLMSTAEPLYEAASGGQYYSLLNQGSGMARVDLAVTADSYILVEGQTDGKVKAQLGDDPERKGVYSFTFTINNLTDKAQDYLLSADVFCQDMFEYQAGSDIYLLDTWTTNLPAAATFSVNGVPVGGDSSLKQYDLNGDGVTNALDADYLLEYLLGNETKIYGEADVNGDGMANSYDAHILLTLLNSGSSDGTVNLPAGGSVTVDVTLTLTAEGRQKLEANYPNGTYVEAFVYAEEVSDEEGVIGTTHSIPVLAFYGNWSDPTMYDRGTLLDLVYMTSNTAPYLYQVVGPYGNALSIDYGTGTEYYFGGNPYLDDDTYLPERNAFNSEDASVLGEQSFTLIRNSATGQIVISNAETGEEYLTKQLGEMYSTIYSPNHGDWLYPIQYVSLNWRGRDAYGNPVPENTLVDVTVTTVPEYYRNEDGSFDLSNLGEGAYLSSQFYIDNTAPDALNIEQVDETTLRVTVKDNRYTAAVALLNGNGTSLMAIESPNQTQAGATVTVDLDLTGLMGQSFLVVVGDYAMNETVYEVTLELPEVERDYFTAINYNTNTYVSLDQQASMTDIAALGIPTAARAAEFAEGYVFVATEDNMLCVANDADLSLTKLIGPMDPDNVLLIDSVADMAYNRVDKKMYALVYSLLNESMVPYLCTVDLTDGTLDVLGEMPEDVHTLTIDDEGTCWSAAYYSPSLYKYTIAGALAGNMTYVGEMGYYGTDSACSMAWDHAADELYYCIPNTLLHINTKTAEPTLLGYFNYQCVGLYISEEVENSPFAPTDVVSSLELNLTNTRVLKNNVLTLEATVWPWNASDRSVTWTSSNTAVATVSSSGLVTGITPGTAVITATSNLDPTKTATCTVTVENIPSKTLNAIIWDEMGGVYMSEFNTDDLPNYTPLHSNSLDLSLAAATINEDGIIYAADLDASTLKSYLYTLDPVTFEPTLIGPSSDGYMDLAPAPGQPGNTLMAVYGGNVMMVDADTGDYFTWYYMFSYNLVGLAYAGTMEYKEWGYDTMIDWYFIFDRVGNVYLMGFLEQDGYYYYMEHDQLAPGGIYTTINFEMETAYFGSAYFDGEYLYFSAYKESSDDVTLMAIDVLSGSKNCYNLGTFAKSVWPVAGLMELNITDLPTFLSVENTAQPQKVDNSVQLESLALGQKEEQAASGSLNSVAPADASGKYDEEDEIVTLDLTNVGDAPNGRMTVTYDASALTFTGITGHTQAFAYTVEDGEIIVAFAEAAALPRDTVIATLTFEPVKSGETTVTITQEEAWDEPVGRQEFVVLDIPATEDVVWVGANVVLTGSIDLNFSAVLSDNVINDPSTFVRFTHNGKSLDVPMSEAVVSVKDGQTRYRFGYKVYAKNMVDPVTAQFMNENGPVGEAKTFSVVQYCNAAMEQYSDNAKLVNVCKAMLNYGAAAQTHFGYKTDKLANAALSAADKVIADMDTSAYLYEIIGSEEGIKPVSAKLILDNDVAIRITFQLTGNKSIDEYTFTIDGQVVTPVATGDRYYIELDGIAASKFDNFYNFSVGGLTVRYCVLSYADMVYKSGASQNLKDLLDAMYAYHEATVNYLGN